MEKKLFKKLVKSMKEAGRIIKETKRFKLVKVANPDAYEIKEGDVVIARIVNNKKAKELVKLANWAENNKEFIEQKKGEVDDGK